MPSVVSNRPRMALLALLLLTPVLLAGCSEREPGARGDADGDGLPDVAETTGWSAIVVTREGEVERNVTSDPHLRDTDGDGLEDYHERTAPAPSDARDFDTDDDGLLDGPDHAAPTEAVAAQWRAAGILERDGMFLGEMGRCGERGLKPSSWSSDLPLPDKLGDGEELVGWDVVARGFSAHVDSDPCIADTDGDTLSDDVERDLGTHPRSNDTDDDGAPDGVDADPAWNLGLELRNLTITGREGVALSLALGAARVNVTDGRAAIDPPDGAPDRTSLLAIGLLDATDAASGEPVALFPGGNGVVLTFDLVKGTLRDASGEEYGPHVRFEGEDGSVSFEWLVTRA